MDFKWLNQGKINIEDDRIEMVAPPQSDFFCNNGAVSEVADFDTIRATPQ